MRCRRPRAPLTEGKITIGETLAFLRRAGATGGDLDYYDDPKREPSETARRGAVFNMKDKEAWIPLVAHTQYWTNSAFVNALLGFVERR